MEPVETLIIGAGVTGLCTAQELGRDYLVLERDQEIGGYCKTVKRAGFTWDYSGHFFHFKHPEIEQWLTSRMPAGSVHRIVKRSFIAFGGRQIDFPFQKNIHQLPHDEFIECLSDLYFARHPAGGAAAATTHANFKEMLYARFGRAISDKFLIPYNQKLYACDLANLDENAMGRFFPHIEFGDVIRNMRQPDNASYNSTFTYPEGGAIEYIQAIASELDPARISTGESLTRVELEARVAHTSRRSIRYQRLVSSAPLNRLLALTGIEHDAEAFRWNKVLVFNLGFDKKGQSGVHWIYFPDSSLCFYRVGFYDNMFDSERMSLYVELGFPHDAAVDADALLPRVLADLKRAGVVGDQRLVAHHSVVMDPAYVHITQRSNAERERVRPLLAEHGVHSIGRYGGWTYCSIEDNVVEARALVAGFS